MAVPAERMEMESGAALAAPLTIMTWFWQTPNAGARFRYEAHHVNQWAEAIRDNTTIPIRIACVTDSPAGIYPWVDIIPPPRVLEDVIVRAWPENRGLPQCYRRLAIFSRNAEQWFGSRFVSMDMDCVVLGNLDSLLQRDDEIAILSVTSAARPYNGGMVMMDAGCRPQVFEDFTPEGAEKASSMYVGSDQAWISYKLGPGESVISNNDGVYAWGRQTEKEYLSKGFPGRLLFFPGAFKVFGQPVDKAETMSHKPYILMKRTVRGAAGTIVWLDSETARQLQNMGVVGKPFIQDRPPEMQKVVAPHLRKRGAKRKDAGGVEQ